MLISTCYWPSCCPYLPGLKSPVSSVLPERLHVPAGQGPPLSHSQSKVPGEHSSDELLKACLPQGVISLGSTGDPTGIYSPSSMKEIKVFPFPFLNERWAAFLLEVHIILVSKARMLTSETSHIVPCTWNEIKHLSSDRLTS